MRNVGVAMSEATLQNTAYSLGIEKLVRNMTEAEKAQLRYIQIMKSSTEWQTDMGRTLITPTNALRVMQQQFVQLGRAIGKIFIPIIMEMMPYVIALTQMLTALAEKIANFFGYKIADIDYSNLGKISGGIKDIGTSAEGTAAKLQTMLAPFDDLNVVQKAGEGSGGIGGGLGGDLGLDLPQYDALAGLTDKFKNNVEAARKTLEKLLPVVAGIGIAFGTWKIGKSVMSLFNTLKGLGLLGATGGGSAAGGLGISASALGVTAGILAFVTSLAIELPKLSKAFDDVAYYGKNFSDVLKSFKTIDFTILQQLLMQPQGQLGVNILLAAKSFGYLKNETVKSVDVLKVFGKELSKSSKKKLSPLISQFESLNKAIVKVDLSGTISEKDINSIHNKLERISTMIINELDSDRNKQLADLKPLEKYMSTADYQNMLNKTNSYFEQQTDIIKVNSEKISAILDNARNRDGQLQRSEMEEITRLRNEMYETGVRSATKNSDEYYKIMSQLKTNLGKLSVEQAGEYIQNAVKTRDESIKAAEEQYSSILAEAYKMKETNQIGETEYKKIVAAAQKAKEESILAAQTQYDEIYKAVVEKLGASGKYIDEETGEIKTNWEVFVDNLKNKWSSGWDKIKTKASDALNRLGGDVLNATNRINGYMEELKRKLERWGVHIKMPHFTWNMNGPSARGVMKKALEALNLPTTLPKLNVSWYKNGGFPTSGELFFANENGIPEMIGKMGNKTAVANNDQIVAGIVNGIQQAFSGFDFGNKSTIVVKIGDKQIYSGYGEYVANENDRYGTNMLKI